jgi:hypothetical protein
MLSHQITPLFKYPHKRGHLIYFYAYEMNPQFISDEQLLKYYRNCENYHKPGPPIQKRTIYFTIDNLLATIPEPGEDYYSLNIDFPIDFIQTTKPRFVHVKNAKYFHLDDKSPSPVQVFICSDINQGEKYGDSFLCTCNDATQYKSLQIFDARTSFIIWIKNERGSHLVINPDKCHVFIELLLEF